MNGPRHPDILLLITRWHLASLSEGQTVRHVVWKARRRRKNNIRRSDQSTHVWEFVSFFTLAMLCVARSFLSCGFCPSVRLPHSGIVLNVLNLGWWGFQDR